MLKLLSVEIKDIHTGSKYLITDYYLQKEIILYCGNLTFPLNQVIKIRITKLMTGIP